MGDKRLPINNFIKHRKKEYLQVICYIYEWGFIDNYLFDDLDNKFSNNSKKNHKNIKKIIVIFILNFM